MARPRGKKRTATQAAATDSVEPEAAAGASSKPEAAATEPATRGRGKRVKAPPRPETDYFSEKRNLEDLWLSAFPVGTEWENIDKIKEFNWSFENLEKALEEGGELHGKTVYIFGTTEPQQLDVNGELKMVFIPTVVAVDCPFPPSDKIGITSVQRENEEIVPMKAMKMAWVPYVPLEDRLSRIDSLKTKIFTLRCTQRRCALKHLKIERVRKFDYCMPYYMPLQPLEDKDDKVINFLYPLEPPIVDAFDWEMDDYEDFADQKVQEGMPEGEKEKFKEFLKEKVRERKRELKQAKEARKKAIDDMDPKLKGAFENIKFYKFYPAKTPDTPDIRDKDSYINRYYMKAHYLMQKALEKRNLLEEYAARQHIQWNEDSPQPVDPTTPVHAESDPDSQSTQAQETLGVVASGPSSTSAVADRVASVAEDKQEASSSPTDCSLQMAPSKPNDPSPNDLQKKLSSSLEQIEKMVRRHMKETPKAAQPSKVVAQRRILMSMR